MSFFNLILDSKNLKYWILFSVLCRMILSLTSQSYLHPDEWYQTVEFANIIGHKSMTYSPEVFFHLRNLTWPAFLSIFLKFLNSSFLIHFFVQLITALLDLVILGAIYQLLNFYEVVAKHWWMVFFCTLHFFLKDSVRPSQEHLSTIAFFASLLCLYQRRFTIAGILCVSIAAFKYSSGMLSAGLALAALSHVFLKQIEIEEFFKFIGGIVAGLFFFGLADLIYYGRLWESLYTYSLYNFFAGISYKRFGEQNSLVYLKYLFSQYKVGHFIIFSLGIPWIIKFLWNDLKTNRYLSFSILLFIIGHMITPHKEGRFIAPLEITFWFLLALSVHQYFVKSWFKILFYCLLILNLVFSFIQLKGDYFKPIYGYFELSKLQEQKPSCAAIILRRPYGFFFSKDKPVQAFFPLGKHDDYQTAMKEKALIWMEQMPNCTLNPYVLIQSFKKEIFLESKNCQNISETHGLWYQCPASILGQFEKQEYRKILIDQFQKRENLWSLDTSSQILEVEQTDFEQKNGLSIGSFPDW
jgi:hypothetical protein